MKNRTKIFVTLFVLLLSACILAACTPSNTPPAQTTAQTTAEGGNNTPVGTTGGNENDGTQTPTLSECEKNGHAEVIDQAVAATCQSTGLTEGKHCSVCNEVIVAQTETPRLDYHTYQNGICTGCKDLQTKGLAYTLIDNSYYAVSGIGTCTDTEIYLPAEYQGLPVKSIGYLAFYCCTSLTSITIPDSVISIGNGAFRNCKNLTSIAIPNSVTSISNAFSECSSLTYNIYDNAKYLGNEQNPYFALITATDTVITSCEIHPQTKLIYRYAFYNCSDLTNITIPDSVTSIGEGAFSQCGSLTSITIPDSVTSIGDSAFNNCSNLIYNVYDNAYYLGNEENPYFALIKASDTSITSCDIHPQTRMIYDYAFDNCRSLTSITIPDSVTSIGNSAFAGFKSLTSITIPDSVTSIGNSAFAGCKSLTSITIPDSVTSIGDSAFQSCTSLASITIPNSVTSIGYYAFSYCSSLTSITIPDSVTRVGNYAFSDCSSLTSVTIPSSVTGIGNYAFASCSSLTSITIPDSVTSIGYNAFYECNSLTYNTYDNATYLGNEENPYFALIRATDTSITSCEMHSQTKVIADYAFSYCSSLTSITIPDSVTSIGDYAFCECKKMTSITFTGTQAEWDSIKKGSFWSPATVVCTG